MISNASITSTMLGDEDHGIFTFQVCVSGSGWDCCFGGYRSDAPGLATVLRQIIRIAGAKNWEDVKGKLIRVDDGGPGSTIAGIGHIIEDVWLRRDEIGPLLRGEES